MSDAQDLKARFEILTDFIIESNEQVCAGRLVALGDLDARVNALCEEVRGAPKETARELIPLMQTMIARLDELAQALAAHKNGPGGSA